MLYLHMSATDMPDMLVAGIWLPQTKQQLVFSPLQIKSGTSEVVVVVYFAAGSN